VRAEPKGLGGHAVVRISLTRRGDLLVNLEVPDFPGRVGRNAGRSYSVRTAAWHFGQPVNGWPGGAFFRGEAYSERAA